MYRFLRSRRWLLVTVALLVVVAGTIVAGRWQLDRSDQRAQRNAAIEAAAEQEPVPVASLLAPGTPAGEEVQWRTVQAVGRYDAEHQLVVRLRPLDGRRGAHVLTPLVTTDGAALLVDRGFVPEDGSPGAVPRAPAPPSGDVEVVARVRLSEEGRGTGGDPASGAVRFVDVGGISATLPYPVYGGWAELVSQRPPAEVPPEPLPAPQPQAGPHLIYAVQWFLFGVVAVVGFVFLVRAEARGGSGRPDGSRARDVTGIPADR